MLAPIADALGSPALPCPALRSTAGHLEIASLSLYFVPRDAQLPITRLPYNKCKSIEL